MASIEIDLDEAVPRIEVRDGRRVMVVADARNEVVFQLPHRDPWRPIQRLGLAAERLRDEMRAAARGDVYRGGRVIVAAEPAPHGPFTGPGVLGR